MIANESNYFPKDSPPNTITLETRVSTMNMGGHKHSVHSREETKGVVSDRECWGLRDCFCCFKMGDFIFILFYFLIFGCVESSLLCAGFSLVAVSGGYPLLR